MKVISNLNEGLLEARHSVSFPVVFCRAKKKSKEALCAKPPQIWPHSKIAEAVAHCLPLIAMAKEQT